MPAILYDEYRTIKNAENFYQGINHIENYKAGVKVDTSYTYNKEGWLASMYIAKNNSVPPRMILYNSDGRISTVYFYEADTKDRFNVSEIVYYSDSLDDCIVKRETRKQQNFTFKYINCELYSKTSMKDRHSSEKEQKYSTIHHEKTITGEGKTTTIAWDEFIAMPPEMQRMSIPFTVEIGEFDPTETFLVNGKISYYDSEENLIESKNVVDGVIVK